MSVKAVILVGGPSRGTRFRPLSLDVPKPLFPIAGHPVLYHHLNSLAKNGEVKEVFLIGFFEDSIMSGFINKVKGEFPGLTVKYLREYQPMGTAGGLYHFRDELRRGNPQGFFVLHADVCSNPPFSEIIAFHKNRKAMCTIVGTKVSRDIAKNFGCLVANPSTDEVCHYVEKPESFVSDLISCGIYFFEDSIFDEIKKTKESFTNGTRYIEEAPYERNPDILRLEQDLLQPLAGTEKIYVFVTDRPWRQLNTASSALLANALFLEEFAKQNPERNAKNAPGAPEIVGNVYIHPSATIHPNVKLGPNVSIGPNVTLEEGVRVREAIVLDNVTIKTNSCIVHAIIGWDSVIGKWCRIEGTSSSESDGNGATITKNGIKIQSTTILGKEVTVRDECVIRNCLVLPNKELKEDFHNEILM